MTRRHLFTLITCIAVIVALMGGCATLDERQRAWIFQPSDRSWGNVTAEGMEPVWIDFQSKVTGEPARLNGLWMPDPRAEAER
ncbi:MAG: hypothetical protein H7332_15495, partial [Bdellovibrionales bacterium]|nr:hypothetical protein [Ramlibacter sp.]